MHFLEVVYKAWPCLVTDSSAERRISNSKSETEYSTMSPWCAKYILPLLECLLQIANHASERTPLDAANSALELPGNADQDDEIDLSDFFFATGNTIA